MFKIGILSSFAFLLLVGFCKTDILEHLLAGFLKLFLLHGYQKLSDLLKNRGVFEGHLKLCCVFHLLLLILQHLSYCLEDDRF